MNTHPFVIFGTARTGSTLLKSLLNAHPAIHCDGELLNPTFWSRPLRPLFLYHVWRAHPRPYIAACRLSAFLRTRRSIYGFKLFERHVPDPGQLLRALHGDGWRVLYIWRRSVFDRALSVLVGKATSHWISIDRSPTNDKAVTIDPVEFMQMTAFIHDQQARCAAVIRAIPHLEIVYEDDLRQEERWQVSLDRISDFLELPRTVAASPVRQTWGQPYRDFVANYADLVQTFQRNSFTDERAPR